MADRYCPYCGELVPSTSLTCPKCYKKIPVVDPTPRSSGESGGSSPKGSGSGDKNGIIALLLALVPGLFGVLGLGILYKNHSSRGALALLVIGIVTFIVACLILSSSIPILNVIFSIPFWLFYALLYIANLFFTLAKRV